jgi:hypothetical protein
VHNFIVDAVQQLFMFLPWCHRKCELYGMNCHVYMSLSVGLGYVVHVVELMFVVGPSFCAFMPHHLVLKQMCKSAVFGL